MRLIDADALKNKSVRGTIGNISGDFIPGFTVDFAPTVDPVRHGRWVSRDEDDYCVWCSVCGDYTMMPDPCADCKPVEDCGLKYCPCCGAKMDEVSDGTL